jgi:hypothetical protein
MIEGFFAGILLIACLLLSWRLWTKGMAAPDSAKHEAVLVLPAAAIGAFSVIFGSTYAVGQIACIPLGHILLYSAGLALSLVATFVAMTLCLAFLSYLVSGVPSKMRDGAAFLGVSLPTAAPRMRVFAYSLVAVAIVAAMTWWGGKYVGADCTADIIEVVPLRPDTVPEVTP